MKKFFMFILIGLCGISAYGDFTRWDINLHYPFLLDVPTQEGNSESIDISQFAFIIPEVHGHYFFEVGPVALGVGGRFYTILIQSFLMPSIAAEVNFGPLSINGSLAGGLAWYFGLAGSGVETGNVFLPQLTGSFRLNNWFDLGLAGTGLLIGEGIIPQDAMPFVGSIFARFRIGGPQEE